MKKLSFCAILFFCSTVGAQWDRDADPRVPVVNGWQYATYLLQGFHPCDFTLTYSSMKDSTFLFSNAGVPENFNGSYAGTGGWFKNQEKLLPAPAFIRIQARIVKKSASTWKVRIIPQLQSTKYVVGYLNEKILPLDGSWVTHTWNVRRMGEIDTMLISGIIRTYWLFQGCTGTDSSNFQLIAEVKKYTFIYPDGSEKIVDFDFTGTDVVKYPVMIPKDFTLYQNYPNPFNPSTTIKYAVPKSEYVTLKIYDLLGKEIVTLVDEFKNVGTHQAKFSGASLSSGLYVYRLQAGKFSETRKMILTK